MFLIKINDKTYLRRGKRFWGQTSSRDEALAFNTHAAAKRALNDIGDFGVKAEIKPLDEKEINDVELKGKKDIIIEFGRTITQTELNMIAAIASRIVDPHGEINYDGDGDSYCLDTAKNWFLTQYFHPNKDGVNIWSRHRLTKDDPDFEKFDELKEKITEKLLSYHEITHKG